MSRTIVTGKTNIDLLNELKENTLNICSSKIEELLSADDWKTTRHIEQLQLIEQNLLETTSLTQEEFLSIASKKQNIRILSNLIEIKINECEIGEEIILESLQNYLNNLTSDIIPTPEEIQGFIDNPINFVNMVQQSV